MRGIRLLQEHAVEFNTLTCVNAANAGRGLDVFYIVIPENQNWYLKL
jgi:sulfatase maturation enzyme AslB (radical SAM superfamily)